MINCCDQGAFSGVNCWLIFQGNAHICWTQFFQQGQAGLLRQPEALGAEAESGLWQIVKNERWVWSSVGNFVRAETRLLHLYWLQIFLSVASSSSVGEIRWGIFQVSSRVSTSKTRTRFHPKAACWSWLRAERRWAGTWTVEMELNEENVMNEKTKTKHAAAAFVLRNENMVDSLRLWANYMSVFFPFSL